MATKYFLLIDGINGGSTDKDHVGWFEIDGFEFDISNAGGTVGGGGGGAGKATFSPLEVALSLDPGLAGLLASVATGKHVKTVQLEGVTANGDTVYDLRLADVLVSKVDEGNGGSDSLAFTYKQVGLITHVQQANGSIVPGASFGFDLAANTTIDPTSIGAPDQPTHLVAELVSTTAHGQLALNPDGSFSYTPDADFSGSDSFVYRANDGSADSNEVTVVINVTAVNDAPVAAAGSAVGIEDKPILGQAVATDIDSPALSYALIGANGGAQHGTVTMNANGQFSYVPTANYHGPDSFAFKASDGALESNLETVSLTINPVNDAPKASPDIAGVYFKEGWYFGHNDAKHPSVIQKDAAHGVLANDTDVDLDALHVSTISFGTTSKTVAPGGSALLQGKYGTLMMKSDGSYAYVAGKEGNAPWHGLAQDRFVYSVDDGHGGKAQSTLTISILDDDMTYLAGKPNTPLIASKGEQVLDGALGNQILAGGKGDDVLIGGPNDILFGGKGHDSFVFNPGFGKNTVVDFGSEDHVLQFSRADFASVKDIFTHMSSDGHGNTLISHDPDNVVTLLDVAPGSLHFHDFLIV
jgi:VCBS repeat-containing protein